MKLKILVEREDGLLAPVETETENLSHDDIVSTIQTLFPKTRPGRPGDQVVVMEVANGATWQQNKWAEDQQFDRCDIFDSAAALSRALGTAANAVGIALKKAKQNNEIEATIRGVIRIAGRRCWRRGMQGRCEPVPGFHWCRDRRVFWCLRQSISRTIRLRLWRNVAQPSPVFVSVFLDCGPSSRGLSGPFREIQ
jgi:hypothetical protein